MKSDTKMANLTNTTEYFWGLEEYWDYVDPVSVDERSLEANKYSIVIAFWVGLAAFVLFLFLILLYMSRSGSVPVRNSNSRKNISMGLHKNCPSSPPPTE